MNGNTVEIVIDIVFAALAVFAVVAGAYVLQKLTKLKKHYRTALILIPLYYNKTWEYIAVAGLTVMGVICVVAMIITTQYIIFSSVLVFIIMVIILMVKMLTCRFAVLDSGIVTPFRYIDWLHLYDYKIEDGKVFFFRDEDGYDTIRAISPRLSFDSANKEKLEFLLSKNKVKN